MIRPNDLTDATAIKILNEIDAEYTRYDAIQHKAIVFARNAILDRQKMRKQISEYEARFVDDGR